MTHDDHGVGEHSVNAHAPVRCTECGMPSGREWTRWRAYRVDDPEGSGDPELAFYCPVCAWVEFGPPRRRPLEDRRKPPA